MFCKLMLQLAQICPATLSSSRATTARFVLALVQVMRRLARRLALTLPPSIEVSIPRFKLGIFAFDMRYWGSEVSRNIYWRAPGQCAQWTCAEWACASHMVELDVLSISLPSIDFSKRR